MTTLPTFQFSIASVAEAERRLGTKLARIIEEIQSEHGLALRTLRTLMAAGMPPAGVPRNLADLFVADWVEESERRADRMILQCGLAACAAAVGPDLGAFLATLEPAHGR